MLGCALLFIVVPVVLSSLNGQITATDWIYRHTEWIDRYIHGNYTAILEYPPLFHVMMLPFVAVDFPVIWFQVLFVVLTTFGILYMAYKIDGEKMMLYTSFLLASSIAYVGFASALMPQALDYFLFPLVVVFYYRNEVKKMSVPLSLLVLMHMTFYVFIMILFAHSLITKRMKFVKIFLVLLIMLFPVFYYYSFITSQQLAWNWNYQAQAEYDKQYLEPLWNFFFYSGFMTWALLPFSIKGLSKNKFKLSDEQLLYVIWIIGFLPIIMQGMGWWRYISFAIVPLSLLVASLIK